MRALRSASLLVLATLWLGRPSVTLAGDNWYHDPVFCHSCTSTPSVGSVIAATPCNNCSRPASIALLKLRVDERAKVWVNGQPTGPQKLAGIHRGYRYFQLVGLNPGDANVASVRAELGTQEVVKSFKPVPGQTIPVAIQFKRVNQLTLFAHVHRKDGKVTGVHFDAKTPTAIEFDTSNLKHNERLHWEVTLADPHRQRHTTIESGEVSEHNPAVTFYRKGRKDAYVAGELRKVVEEFWKHEHKHGRVRLLVKCYVMHGSEKETLRSTKGAIEIRVREAR